VLGLGCLGAALLLAGAAVVVILHNANAPEPSPEGSAGATAAGGPAAPPPADLDYFQAQRLIGDPWHRVDEPRPEPEHGQVRMDDVGATFMPYPDGSVFKSEIWTASGDVIPHLVITFHLVGDDGRVYARTNVPAILVGERKQVFSLIMPQDLYEQMAEYVWTLKDSGLPMLSSAYLEDVTIEPSGDGVGTAVVVRARHAGRFPLKGATFLVRAFDSTDWGGNVVAQWRVEYDRIIPPGQSIEFAALTKVDPSWGAQRWGGLAAGERAEEMP
jgi:hypothetical protein